MSRSAPERRPKVPISVIVSTKNEELAIVRCLGALEQFSEVIVVDSESTDRTVELARHAGAKVVNFHWNGDYPKKKQWCLDNVKLDNPWVLFIDADEIVSTPLALAIEAATRAAGPQVAAFDIPLRYRFQGKTLRFGHVVKKRALVRPAMINFPVYPDLEAPGMGELEGHYQPVALGSVGELKERILHDDPDPLASWVDRHNRYSDWEAYLRRDPSLQTEIRRQRSMQGRFFDRLPLKPLIFFAYSYVLRFGFLDGRAGFDYAFALAFYYWLISAKVREGARSTT